jgi:hypothetical protein
MTTNGSNDADSVRVYYPHGGHHFCLRWWTDDDRGHVVLARTERSLLAAAKRVFDAHPDAEIRGYSEIDIVAPPKRLEALIVEEKRRERVRFFHLEVACRVRELADAGRDLPPMFARCTKYEPKDASDAQHEVYTERHYDCRHCIEGICLVGVTPDEFCERYYATWTATQALVKPTPQQSKRLPSRAPRTRDAPHLHYAYPMFGPHSSGVEFDKIVGKRTPSHDEVLFFFRTLRSPDLAPLEALRAEAKARDEERRAIRVQESAAKDARDRERRFNATLAVFGAAPSSTATDASATSGRGTT